MTAKEYEFQLCDALMGAMGGGVTEVEGLAAALNKSTVPPPQGSGWTADLLKSEMHRIGAPPAMEPYSAPLRFQREVPPELHQKHPKGNGSAAPDYEKTVEHLLELGVRNTWYCVAGSQEVHDKPFSVTALGEKLVLWRDKAGKVCATEDRCPHRGIALSIGSVYEGRIRCAYHGIEIDHNGIVCNVPAYPECAYNGKKMIRDYPAIEHYQGIWVYFGDDKHPNPPPLELPEELTRPEWSGLPFIETWTGHYQYVYDNICDPMHGSFLHGTTFMQSRGTRSDTIGIKDTDHGFEVFREGQQGVSFDWMEFIDVGACRYMRIKVGFPPAAGPGGHLRIIFFVTPVDRERTKIFAWRLRKVSGWQADLWHFLYKTRLGIHMAAVLEQDRVALTALPAWPPQEENLYQHDLGIVRARRHMRQLAEAQAREYCGIAAPVHVAS